MHRRRCTTPRARPFSKADIAARRRAARPFSDETVAVPVGESRPDSADVPDASAAKAAVVEGLLDRIAEIAHVDSERRPRFREEVRVLLQRYEVETLQNRQEHPKREIAALGPVQVDVRRLLKRLRARSKRLRRSRRATARRLLKRLQSLPEGLRHPLGAGNTETRLVELIGATKAQLAAAIDNVETQLE